MSKAQGVIAQVSAKEWGDVTLHSFQLADNNFWFRTGTTKVPAKKGEYVSFEYEEQKGKVDLDSFSISEAPATERAASVVKAAGSYKGGGGKFSGRGNDPKDDYWRRKDEKDDERDARYQAVDIPRMTYGNAQDTAVTLVLGLLDKGVLSAGAKNGAKAFDLVLGYVKEATETLFTERMNAHEIGRVGADKEDTEPNDEE